MANLPIRSKPGPTLPLLCLAGLLGSWGVMVSSSDRMIVHPAANASPPQPEPLAADGLENLWRLPLQQGKFLYSGGQPEGAQGFRELQALDVRTVISVDGARPEIETARQYGIRYVHLPIGYDRVPDERLAEMVRAVRMLPGPIYVHCHHGKHRGPAAAVCVWRSLNERITPDAAVDFPRAMGTHAKYGGLYRSVEQAQPIEATALRTADDFPEVTAVTPLAEQMVAIDQVWEQWIAASQAAADTTGSPRTRDELWADLTERFRESELLLEPNDAARELRDALAETAAFLEHAVVEDRSDVLQAELGKRCAACHARFRD